MAKLDTSTPVLILGGADNAISVCRHLGRRGITVRVSGNPATCWGLYSRYCRQKLPVPEGSESRDFWKRLLLSGNYKYLHGHLVFACNDEAVEFVAMHRDELQKNYILPEQNPELQLALLDKKRTLELARAAGIPVPQFWTIKTVDDVKAIRADVKFPVMVKPIHSYKFQRVFRRKLFIIDSSFDELLSKATEVLKHGLEMMIVEMIPGPDALLCSQLSYTDSNGNELYNYTKRVIRRYPVNSGPTCCHITEWLPEVNELARKFLKGIKFRGLANPEFKRDLRDGKLKLIEINVRFMAAHELVVRSGLPLDLVVYCHLTGQPKPAFSGYTQFLTLWYPAKDFMAFRQLSKRGELTLIGWLKSVLRYRKILAVFQVSDPWPSVVVASTKIRKQISKIRHARRQKISHLIGHADL